MVRDIILPSMFVVVGVGFGVVGVAVVIVDGGVAIVVVNARSEKTIILLNMKNGSVKIFYITISRNVFYGKMSLRYIPLDLQICQASTCRLPVKSWFQ